MSPKWIYVLSTDIALLLHTNTFRVGHTSYCASYNANSKWRHQLFSLDIPKTKPKEIRKKSFHICQHDKILE